MFEINHCYKNKIVEISFKINKNSIPFRFLQIEDILSHDVQRIMLWIFLIHKAGHYHLDICKEWGKARADQNDNSMRHISQFLFKD